MSTFEFTHTFAPDSSALAQVYYNELSSELVVVTHNAVLAGYLDVPVSVFTSFMDADSAGSFWNREVKPNFRGFNTGFIDEFVERSGYLPIRDNKFAPSAGVDAGSEPAPDDSTFLVGFSHDLDTYGSELYVYATSPYQALDKINEIASVAGWKSFVVTGLTREG